MTRRRIFTVIIPILAIIYLAIGTAFYLQDMRAQAGLLICTQGGAPGAEDCHSEEALRNDWPTAVTLIVGWLPLLLTHGG